MLLKAVKKLADAHIFISICGVFFYWSGLLIVQRKFVNPDLVISLLIFFSTLFIYQFNDPQNQQLRRLGTSKKIFAIANIFIVLVLACFLEGKMRWPFIHLGMVSMLYSIPGYLFVGRKLYLRAFPFLKVVLIAHVWAGLPYFVVNAQVGHQQPFSYYLMHFGFIMAITLPFDIRDYDRDKIGNTQTIPHLIGIKATQIISVLCAVLWFSLSWLVHGFTIYTFILALSLIILLTPTKQKNLSQYYYTVLLDGSIILYYFVWLMVFRNG